MNRKTFLATIAACFGFKSKEKTPTTKQIDTAADIARYYKVPPAYLQDYERATFYQKVWKLKR